VRKKVLLILIVVTIIVIAGIIVAINNSDSTDTNIETINVSEVTRSVFYSPQYVAIQKGFFEKYGIKRKIPHRII